MDVLIVIIALAKAQQLLLDPQEREYLLSQVTAAKGWQIYLLAYSLRLRIFLLLTVFSVEYQLCRNFNNMSNLNIKYIQTLTVFQLIFLEGVC